jgi:hypothetical protein
MESSRSEIVTSESYLPYVNWKSVVIGFHMNQVTVHHGNLCGQDSNHKNGCSRLHARSCPIFTSLICNRRLVKSKVIVCLRKMELSSAKDIFQTKYRFVERQIRDKVI